MKMQTFTSFQSLSTMHLSKNGLVCVWYLSFSFRHKCTCTKLKGQTSRRIFAPLLSGELMIHLSLRKVSARSRNPASSPFKTFVFQLCAPYSTHAGSSSVLTMWSITRAERVVKGKSFSLYRHDFTCCQSGVSVLSLPHSSKYEIKFSSCDCVTLKFVRRSSKEVRKNEQEHDIVLRHL